MLNSRLMRPSMCEHRHHRLDELLRHVLLEVLDHLLVRAAAALDPGAKRLVGLRLEVLERQFLELVLDLAHPEPVGDRRVDVPRLLRDLDPPLLGQMVQRPHVVEPIRQLHQDHADVVDHREQHLAEVLRLPLLARRELDRAQLGDAFHDVRHVGAEELLDTLDRRLRVLDDVVQEPGRNRHDIELHVGEQVGDLEGMDQVWLPGMADLPLVLEGREDVRPPQQLNVGLGIGVPDLVDEVLEPNHNRRCLTSRASCCAGQPGRSPRPKRAAVVVDGLFFGSLY